MTPRRLRNIAVAYFESRTTTRGHLERLLMRRIHRSLEHHPGDASEMRGWLPPLLDELERMGLLDDRAWAESRLARLRRKGMSARAIRANLREKLVPADLIDELMDIDRQDPLVAGVKYARRRGIGPFRERDREARRDKDLGRLARAGFPYDVARRVLDLDREEADDLYYESL